MAEELSTYYTANELAYIHSLVIDKHFKDKPVSSAVYDKPTLKKILEKKKSYGAIQEYFDKGVKGVHGANGVNDSVTGLAPSDKLKRYNPTNVRRAKAPHKKMHIGIEFSEDEAERYGIIIDDGFRRPKTQVSDIDPRLYNGIKDKAEDLDERAHESLSRLIWSDGTADPKSLAGILAHIRDNPTTGIVNGIDSGTNAWWRNRAFTTAHGAAGGQGAITSSTSNGGELLRVLHDDSRQLSIYGPIPDLFPCGSDFLEAAELEYRANGQYSQTGFTRGGDAGVGSLAIHGVTMYFEPELDLIGRSKYGYRISSQDLCLYTQQNNWMRTRNPARPHDELVVHQDLLFAGNMLTTRLRNQAVYQIN